MVALGVVLGDRLPVGLDLVGDPLGAAEGGEVEPLEVAGQVVEDVDERSRGRVEAQEDEPLPRLAADRDEASSRRARSRRGPRCAWRAGAGRRGRRSRRGTGTGCGRALPQLSSRIVEPRWRQTLWKARSSPSAPRTTMTLSPAIVARKYSPGFAASSSRPTQIQSRPNQFCCSKSRIAGSWKTRGGRSRAALNGRRTASSSAAVRIGEAVVWAISGMPGSSHGRFLLPLAFHQANRRSVSRRHQGLISRGSPSPASAGSSS